MFLQIGKTIGPQVQTKLLFVGANAHFYRLDKTKIFF